MAGVELPGRGIPGRNMSNLVDNILEYEEYAIANRKLEVLHVRQDSADTSVSLVYFVKRYALDSIDYNIRFLEFGYGRFADNVDSLHRLEYKKAEAMAISRKKGLWAFRLPEVKDTLDRKYSLMEISYYQTLDSSNQIEYLRRTSPHVGWQITGQILSGALAGGLGSILTGMAGAGIDAATSSGREFRGLAGAILGIAAGYTIFTPVGVCMAAESYNPALKYLPAVGLSLLTTAAGIGIASLGRNQYGLWIIPAAMPLVSSLIYVNLLADNPVRVRNQAHTGSESIPAGNYAFKDYYNNNMQFRINVINISF
ncbi:MAG: hypothetical protein ACM3Q2_04545 [Syntrophothermus sp.]